MISCPTEVMSAPVVSAAPWALHKYRHDAQAPAAKPECMPSASGSSSDAVGSTSKKPIGMPSLPIADDALVAVQGGGCGSVQK